MVLVQKLSEEVCTQVGCTGLPDWECPSPQGCPPTATGTGYTRRLPRTVFSWERQVPAWPLEHFMFFNTPQQPPGQIPQRKELRLKEAQEFAPSPQPRPRPGNPISGRITAGTSLPERALPWPHQAQLSDASLSDQSPPDPPDAPRETRLGQGVVTSRRVDREGRRSGCASGGLTWPSRGAPRWGAVGLPEFQKLPWAVGKDSTRPGCTEGRAIALERPSPLLFYRFLCVLPLDWETEATTERGPSACFPCCWQSLEH